jgi:hypothetical protein
VAAYLHVILLLAFGLFVIDRPIKTAPLVLHAVLADYEQTAETPVMRFETAQATKETQPETPQPEPEPNQQRPEEKRESQPFESAELAELLGTSRPSVDSSDQTTTESRGDSPASGRPNSAGPEPPAPQLPSHAVTSGRFSAWTEPESPQPGQPYRIIVLVRLPARIQRYYSSDLTGTVIGADGYRKHIRGSSSDELPLVNHTARIAIPIVGAERGWKDTIVVQSRILRERRVLELIYNRGQNRRRPFGNNRT